MKKLKLNILCTFIISVLFIPMIVHAGSFSTRASSSSVTVGSTVTVSVTGSDIAGRFDISSSDSSIFSGGGNVWVDKDTQSVKFTAKSAGSVVITIKPTNVADYSGNKITGNKTLIIKSYIPRALETNNYLSNLSVDGAELTPSFNKETDSYVVDLEPGTTSINVNATKENKYASISGDGEISVVEGNNDISVVVTSESGAKRTYHISAVVKEFDPIKLTIDGSDFTVVRKHQELTKPDNYEDTTVEIDGNTVPAFTNSITGYTLVGLKDVTGKVKLYIYDASNNSYIPYLALSFSKLDLIILEASDKDIPKGFIKDTITINNETVTCYKNKELGITLIYGKSVITGESNFYSFENTDMTVQKFNFDMLNKINKKIELYSYVILGLGGLVFLILIIIIISKISGKKKLKTKKDEIEKTMKIDTNAIKNESALSKKELKKQAKELKKKQEREVELMRQKEESLKEAEIEKQKVEAKEKKRLEKLEKKQKKNKDKPDKYDDMFNL